MKKNSEQQDRFLGILYECSEELSALAEKLEAEGRRWDSLTDAEIRLVEELDRRVKSVDLQLNESAKESRMSSSPVRTVRRGLRI